jgi:hypothetical protein
MAAAAVLWAAGARADITIWKSADPADRGWEVFTNGRVSTFFSWTRGDALPQGSTYDQGRVPYQKLHDVKLDPCCGVALPHPDTETITVNYPDGTVSPVQSSRLDTIRIRSGMQGNVLGIGVRRSISAETKVVGYLSIVSIVDSRDQRKFFPLNPNAREGYVRVDAPWGTVVAGRTATLFDRGAYESDVLTLHGYGVGFAADPISNQQLPTYGQIGLGILPMDYAAGFIYATPALVGVRLHVGVFDPASFLGGAAKFKRTREPRPEFELTADEAAGGVRLHLYFNGAAQTIYRSGEDDSVTQRPQGVGYGARLEAGPVRFAAGGHRGTGIGFTYFGNSDSSVMNDQSELRQADGYYAMGQLALGRFELDGGVGISRAGVLDQDKQPSSMNMPNPGTGAPDPQFSWITSQTGISAALVYHPTDWLHVDFDVLYATFKWNLGEQQKVTFFNAGMTLTW